MSHPSEKEKKNGKDIEQLAKCCYFRETFYQKEKKLRQLGK